MLTHCQRDHCRYNRTPFDDDLLMKFLLLANLSMLFSISRQLNSFFLFFFFFNLTYSRWTSSLPSCLWSQRIFPSLPGSRLTIFLSRCKFSTLTTRQPMVEFYLLAFPRFPLRKKEHKSYKGKNRTHDFRTSRYAGYPLDHSGDYKPHIRGLPSVRWLEAVDLSIVPFEFSLPNHEFAPHPCSQSITACGHKGSSHPSPVQAL